MEKLPELFDVADIRSRIDDFTPYIMVAIQVSCQEPIPSALSDLAKTY